MLNLYDVVRLKNDREDANVKAGSGGTIIDVLGGGSAYTVEFFDDKNETIEESVFATFAEDELVLVQ